MDEFWKTVSKGKENIRFRQAEVYSPYCEVSMGGIEQINDQITRITMNGFYRYESIMQPLLGKNGVTEKQKEWIFDIYMHYLTELEYRSGVTYQEYVLRCCWNDIEKGWYGDNIREAFQSLTEDEKYRVAHSLYQQSMSRESVERFTDTLVGVLHNGIVYKNKFNEKELYLYMSNKKNEYDISKIDLIKQLFQPIGYELRIFWGYHFAVMGQEQTMQMGEIELL